LESIVFFEIMPR